MCSLLKMSQDGSKPYDGKTIPDNLPDGWEAVWDSNYERYYFYAAAWEESVWDIPTIAVVGREKKAASASGGDGNEAGGASHDGTAFVISADSERQRLGIRSPQSQESNTDIDQDSSRGRSRAHRRCGFKRRRRHARRAQGGV